MPALSNKKDRRVDYIHQSLQLLNQQLAELGSCLTIFYDRPLVVLQALLNVHQVQTVFCSRDYELSAVERDKGI